MRVCEVGVLAIPSSLAAGVHASFARGCVRRRKKCVVSTSASYVPLSASFPSCAETLPILLLSAALHSAAHEVNECVRVCVCERERERERALSLLSLLRHWQLPPPPSLPPPCLPHSLPSVGGLNQVTGLM